MMEFFKPWRRKLGGVTLLLAYAFATGWVRSTKCEDAINIFGIILRSRAGAIEQTKSYIFKPQGSAYPTFKERVVWQIPYSAGAVPFTLISAWLLLSQPRPAKPKAEPASKTGEAHA